MRRKLSVLALSLLACSGEALDVGNNTAGAGGTTGGGARENTPPGPELQDWSTYESCSVTGDGNEAYVGIWDGAVEDFFLNPSTRIRLEITAASLDGVCGRLHWGFGTDPPRPLTDPNESGVSYGMASYAGPQHYEGVTYTILDGVAREDTLRIATSSSEVWRGFCESQEQTYYHSNGGSWHCVEPFSQMVTPTDDGATCNLLTSHGTVSYPVKVCTGCAFSIAFAACGCNSTGCAASILSTNLFDFSLEGSGSDVLTMPYPGTGGTIRLTRTE